MISLLAGAVLNVGLDALFMLGFGWGIAGAAAATTIGQIVSALFSLYYMPRFKTITLNKSMFRIRWKYVKPLLSLGSAYFFYQFVMMLSQIVMNNTLNHYGALSAYGSDIPFAVVAVISKVLIFINAFLGGIGQSCQPIFGYNYGAKRYERVKETYIKGIVACTAIAVVAFLALQLFPRQIIGIFGSGSEEYFQFAERYMRIFMALIFVSGVQPLTTQFFTSTGKAGKGTFLSLSRQGIFFIPAMIILPIFLGIDGVLYAGPLADALAVILSVCFSIYEFNKMSKVDLEETQLKEELA